MIVLNMSRLLSSIVLLDMLGTTNEEQEELLSITGL